MDRPDGTKTPDPISPERNWKILTHVMDRRRISIETEFPPVRLIFPENIGTWVERGDVVSDLSKRSYSLFGLQMDERIIIESTLRREILREIRSIMPRNDFSMIIFSVFVIFGRSSRPCTVCCLRFESRAEFCLMLNQLSLVNIEHRHNSRRKHGADSGHFPVSGSR